MSDKTTVENKNVPNKEQEEPVELYIDPRVFERHSEAHITCTSDLTRLINESFSILTDFSGCRVYIFTGGNPDIPPEIRQTMAPGGLYCDLYFNKNDHVGGKIESLVPANSTQGNTDTQAALSRFNRVTNASHVQTPWVLNQETQQLLHPFVSGYSYFNNRQFNAMWQSRMIPECAQVTPWGSNNQRVILRVVGFDVDSLMGLVYGVRDDPTDLNTPIRYDYHCIPVATSAKNRMMYGYPQAMGNGNEYVIQILRNDRKIISAMRDAMGIDMLPMGSTYTPLVSK